MSHKRFFILFVRVATLTALLLAMGQARSVLSAPASQNEQYRIAVNEPSQKLCPGEHGQIGVIVFPNPEEIDLDHPERNNPVLGADVIATVSLGTLSGLSGTGTTASGLTNLLGIADFDYLAPEGHQGSIVSLQVQATWTEPWSGRTIQLQTTDHFFLAQCSYDLWIVDHHAIESPWNGFAIGLVHAQVDDVGNLTGQGTMDLWGSSTIGEVTSQTHSQHAIDVTGHVTRGTAYFVLQYTTKSAEYTVTSPNGSRTINAQGPDISTKTCQVDAFKGGKVMCPFRTIVEVIRK